MHQGGEQVSRSGLLSADTSLKRFTIKNLVQSPEVSKKYIGLRWNVVADRKIGGVYCPRLDLASGRGLL
jgi:hypothetical protein